MMFIRKISTEARTHPVICVGANVLALNSPDMHTSIYMGVMYNSPGTAQTGIQDI